MSGDTTTPTIAQRFVACKRWEWLPGMLTGTGLRVDGVGYKGRPMRVVWGTGLDSWTRQRTECYDSPSDGTHDVPDLNDDATRGCVLGLVRKAWGEPRAYAFPRVTRPGWSCVVYTTIRGIYGPHQFEAATEAEALFAALEAAP